MIQIKNHWLINPANIIIAVLFFLGLFISPVTAEQVKNKQNINLWTGEWQSSKYKSISGKLIAHIPEKIPHGQVFPVPVDIYYNPESFYKGGKTVKVDFEGMMTKTGWVAGGGESKTDPKIRRKLSLKGRSAWSFQVIEYSAVINEKTTGITGSYQAKWPSDQGSFSLHLATEK